MVRRTAIVALTNNGARLGETLRSHLEGSDLFVPPNRTGGVVGVNLFDGGVAEVVGRAFREYDRLLLIFSTGIAVRSIARCLESKCTDPAVVVMDEKGRFAISLLSGHSGGANELARQVAELVGATPVITTASDVNNTLAVDLLGSDIGWEIDDWASVTRASAAIVNGEPVGVFQDAGETGWLSEAAPPNIRTVDDIADLEASELSAALIVTDRVLDPTNEAILAKSVVYRPRSLAVGLGCNRGTAVEEIDAVVRDVLRGQGLSFRCIRTIATIDVKRSEVGLVEFARRVGVPVIFYSSVELDAVEGIANPSEMVLRAVGCRSVCEAAALLGAGSSELVVAKTGIGNVTVAVARVPCQGWASIVEAGPYE